MHHLSICAGTMVVLLEESGVLRRMDNHVELLPLCIRNGCKDRSSLCWFRFGYRNRIVAHALADKYPLPDHISEDGEAMEWIREQRRIWLQFQEPDESPVLASVRVLLSSTSEA
jgi:hypothetical protein